MVVVVGGGQKTSKNERRRTEQRGQVDGNKETESVPSSPGPASSKVYFNVISHYITEAGTQQLGSTHTHTNAGGSEARVIAN